jgi:hypothetical protein
VGMPMKSSYETIIRSPMEKVFLTVRTLHGGLSFFLATGIIASSGKLLRAGWLRCLVIDWAFR